MLGNAFHSASGSSGVLASLHVRILEQTQKEEEEVVAGVFLVLFSLCLKDDWEYGVKVATFPPGSTPMLSTKA